MGAPPAIQHLMALRGRSVAWHTPSTLSCLSASPLSSVRAMPPQTNPPDRNLPVQHRAGHPLNITTWLSTAWRTAPTAQTGSRELRIKCEQIAAESEGIHPDSQFVCQRDISGEFNDRYGTAFRVDDRYFVAGTTRNGKKKGALVTKADVETIIEFAECTWDAPELIVHLQWTDDQDVDDTVRRFLSVVPFQPNFVRDARLNMKLLC